MMFKKQALTDFNRRKHDNKRQTPVKPTGCPQKLWDRVGDSTRQVLLEAAKSK